jgi:hypothetical protein
MSSTYHYRYIFVIGISTENKPTLALDYVFIYAMGFPQENTLVVSLVLHYLPVSMYIIIYTVTDEV